MTPEGLIDRSLAEFARAVAAPRPMPGSGSVAAALGALGAGLASMALGSVRGEGRAEGASREAAAELARLMEGLLARVELDAQAYAAYLDARAGRGSLAAALEHSIAVPREIAEQALSALERLVEGFAAVRPRLFSEGFTATRALLAAVEGATFTAGSNVALLGEERERDERRRNLEQLRARARELARVVEERVGAAR